MSTADLAAQVNPFDPAFKADPYPVYRELRAELPIHKSVIGTWIVADYPTCDHVLRSRDFGKDFANSKFFRDLVAGSEVPPPMLGLGIDGDARPFMLTDPPDHTRLRGLVASAFNRRSAGERDAMIDRIAAQHAERFGEGDFIDTVAEVLPIQVLAQVLGIPASDQSRFSGWSRSVAGILDIDPTIPPEVATARSQAISESMDYFKSLAQDPACPPGLIGELNDVSEGAGGLTLDEIAATCLLLVVAGQETTSNTLGNMMACFSRNPAQYRLLCDGRATVEDAVREVLRFEPPAHEAGRIALKDVELNGASIEEGDAVMLMLASANRDEAANHDGERFDITRPASNSLTYGRGIHHCLGSALANSMLEHFLGHVVDRYASITVAEPLSYKPGLGLRGPATLDIEVSQR